MVTITSPASSGTVSGIVVIDGEVKDTNLASVSLIIDDIPVSATLPYSWNTTQSNPGVHIIEVSAQDKGGNTALDSIGVLISLKVLPLPGYTNPPTDPDNDGLFEDLNANGFADWDDAVVLFWNTDWIQEHEPVENFDFNNNGFIDWDDAVTLFWEV